MQSIFVQFVDTSQTAICSVFTRAQDPAVWKNQGQVQSSDQRYATYFDAQPTIIQGMLPEPGQ